MGQYFEAKAILFQRLVDAARGVSVTFVDDEAGQQMRKRATGARLGVARSAGARGADVVIEAAELGADGTRATLATPVGRLPIESPLVGDYNLANLALAVGMMVARGVGADAIVAGATEVAVPGRLERVANDRDVLCVVDYAHTPDGLERAIGAMRPLTRGRLIVVFGCGGDRDPSKRPIMGEIAARDGDLAIVTSDNPRKEDPAAIVSMILDGVRRTGARELSAQDLARADRGYHTQIDRRFRNRMLLAEANQWPEDAVAYFGDGDECHMSFHFPVMPRMFMALRMEDRFPIIDILAQTPHIPDVCQWALEVVRLQLGHPRSVATASGATAPLRSTFHAPSSS